MSNKMLNLVRDALIGDPTAKEVLKLIADQCNDAGSGVWSSFAYIAWCLERDRSTIIKKCKLLQDEGILTSAKRQGRTNLWYISPDKLTELGRTYRDKIEVDEVGSELETDQGDLETGVVVSGDPSPLEPQKKQELSVSDENFEEPTYEVELDNFLIGWKTCFPNKPQPRASTAITKFKVRFKNEGFRANWRKALWATKDLDWAHEEGWFKWQWVLHNNENYAKLLDGTFDFKLGKDGKKPEEIVNVRLTKADFEAMKEVG